MKNFKIKEATGITLVALVATMVVLVILAGVSISLVLGQYGIIGRAQTAGETQRNAQSLEEAYLQNADLYINEQIAAAGEGGAGGDKSLIKTGEAVVTNGTTKPYLPSDEFKVSDVSTEQTVAQGLVIKHKTIGDEYVWIEVPRTATVYPTAGTTLTDEQIENNYNKIENDLHTYTATFRNNTLFTDTWYSQAQTGLTQDQYNTKKKAMLKSIYKNGGFYIGRYEAGIAGTKADNVLTGRSTHTDILANSTEIPVSQADFIPYNWIYCSEAQTLANNVASGNKTSSLMFGVQWDLVLKYLQEKGNLSLEQLNGTTTGSIEWGNYLASDNFILTKGKYATWNGSNLTEWSLYKKNTNNYVSYTSGETSTKLKGSMVLLTTGAMPSRNMKQNIHDFAGNAHEWTLEYSTDTSRPCNFRGGSFGDGSNVSASYRGYCDATDSYASLGFRVSIY